jgi:alcohol dehydrogenase
MDIAPKTYGFYIPCVTLMGLGCHRELGSRAVSLGAGKPLIVTDEGMTKVGLVDTIASILRDAMKVDPIIFDGTVPNPTDANVDAGLDMYRRNDCDMIVSLGGGSAHDCAKGIGIVASNGGSIRDYEGVDQSKRAMPPLIAVNTTAGTASEMTRFCIITDTSRHVKMAIIDWRVTPTIAINDPELMKGMPPFLTACTGMDALTHAVEAYVSTIATPVTDACALRAISLVARYLRPAVANGGDMFARDRMAYAEYLAGMAFNNASLGYVHAMAHQLGGFYNLPHGMCNAILLPHVSRFNLMGCLDRFVDIAVALGNPIDGGISSREAAECAITSIRTLSADVGIPSGLAGIGVKEKDIATMAQNAMKDACGATNPRRATLADIEAIYRGAL